MLPFSAVLRDSRFGRLLPGFAASNLGDGMSAIAISWLALQLAPPTHRARWVALAVAAYTFPGALGTFALAGALRGRPGAQLVTWNSSVRAISLGAIALLGVAGIGNRWSFVALLAVSSVLHAWGSAGAYAMVAELLPAGDHLPANALLGMLAQAGVLIGPPIAGVVIAWQGAGWVLALDALSFAVLALSCRLAVPRRPRPAPPVAASRLRMLRRVAASWSSAGEVRRPADSSSGVAGLGRPGDSSSGVAGLGHRADSSSGVVAPDRPADSRSATLSGEAVPASGGPSRWAGFRVLAGDRQLAGLLALTFGFYTLYGPFEIGLPVYIAGYRHAPASHLAWYFTAFGAGAIAGGLIAGYLRSWPLGPATAGIVIGVGAALLPLGLGVSDPVGVACYALAGLFFGPYSSLITALIQRVCDPSSIAQVLAARGTVIIASGPAGVGLGALLITTLSVRRALFIAAAATLLLGVTAAAASRSSRWRLAPDADQPEPGPAET